MHSAHGSVWFERIGVISVVNSLATAAVAMPLLLAVTYSSRFLWSARQQKKTDKTRQFATHYWLENTTAL
jgi:hypothetical protein